jgi:transcriptional regulator of nitric oxide reductase
VGALGVVVLLGSAALLMSDRVPGLLKRVSRRIDSGSSRAAQLASANRPQSDFEIHVIIWATVMVLVGLAMWSNRSVLASAVAVLATSVVAERAQVVFSSTREMQLADVIANCFGVLAGLGAVAGLAILMGWKDHPAPGP